MEVLADARYRDYCGAAILVVLGVATAFQSLHYKLGTLTRMGPGFVPAALGVILVILGVALFTATLARKNPAPGSPLATMETAPFKPEWRGWICICLGLILFAALSERAGLIPAVFISVFVTALGDRENRFRDALLLALGMTVAAVVIFWWGLSVLMPLVKWDLG